MESWWSSDALFKDNHQLFAMNPMFQFSFGALLRSDTSSVLTATNDAFSVDEDTGVAYYLRENDVVDFSQQIEGLKLSHLRLTDTLILNQLLLTTYQTPTSMVTTHLPID